MEGIFAINKPSGMTSHDVVAIIRRQTGIKRVGHGGTLDPFATGVLVIAVGREYTKKLSEYVKGEKEYEAEIRLGATSTTDDIEGKMTERTVANRPSLNEIRALLPEFTGRIMQTPPIYSSIKLQGKPAHRRVRRGEDVKLEAREVEVKSIEILSYEYPILKLRIATGPGVYIRAIARDLGEKLQTGGYLSALTRTRVGEYFLKNAKSINTSL